MKAGTCQPSSRAGFTLLELVVVLAIIGFIAATVIPQTRLYDGVELRSSARNLGGTIRITYDMAAVSRKPHRIAFDLERQCYHVEHKEGRKYAISDHPLLRERCVSDLVYIRDVRAADRQCSSFCTEYLYFTPGGFVEEAVIHLATMNNGQAFTVITHPMTGRTEIKPGLLEMEDFE